MLQQRPNPTLGAPFVLLLIMLFVPFSGVGAETVSAVSPPVTLTLPSVDQPPTTGRRNKHAIAVLIGNRDYDPRYGIPQVPFAIRDVEAVQKHLVNILGYRSNNIIRRENVTLAALNALFGTPRNPRGELAKRVESGNYDVFVYYSGHGAPAQESRQGYLIPTDADPAKIEFMGYPLDILSQNLSRLRTQKLIVVLDTCFSGDTPGGSLFPETSGAWLVAENPLLALKNAFVLTASTGREMANWYSKKQHGLFTYYFLLGLQIMANDPGGLSPTAVGLKEFIIPRVREAAQELGRSQTPEIIGPPGRTILP